MNTIKEECENCEKKEECDDKDKEMLKMLADLLSGKKEKRVTPKDYMELLGVAVGKIGFEQRDIAEAVMLGIKTIMERLDRIESKLDMQRFN